MGGPLEEVATTSYPPCRPGPGDDRCIQLYERGVTGSAQGCRLVRAACPGGGSAAAGAPPFSSQAFSLAIVRSSAAMTASTSSRIGAGGGDVGEPIGLGQPVLAGLAVGDGDAEKRLLGLDPGLALGAHRVEADARHSRRNRRRRPRARPRGRARPDSTASSIRTRVAKTAFMICFWAMCGNRPRSAPSSASGRLRRFRRPWQSAVPSGWPGQAAFARPERMSAAWTFSIDRGGTFTDIVARAPGRAAGRAQTAVRQSRALRRRGGRRDRRDPGRGRRRRDRRGARWGRRSPPTPCSSARASRWRWRSPPASATRCGSATRRGPTSSRAGSSCPSRSTASSIEVDERVTAEGEVLRPLDAGAARAALQAAFDEGYRALAIVLMHGWRWTAHEAALAAMAREIGFTQVSASHEVEPLIKLIGRGDTAVVDAYLSPVLRRYVDKVVAGLGGAGPAVLHAVERRPDRRRRASAARTRSCPARPAASSAWRGPRREAGVRPCHRLRHGRHLDRRLPFRRRLRADQRARRWPACGCARRCWRSTPSRPAAARSASMTAAASGSARTSAGAVPGPACYRRGGPLTVTDCNVVLGKIRPEHFPRVFGPGGDQPIDAAASLALLRGDRRAGRDGRRARWPRASCASRSTIWPMRSSRSRSPAATTSPATRCNASAAPAASMPAWSPTRSASAG